MSYIIKPLQIFIGLILLNVFAYAEGTRELEPTTRATYVTKFQIGNDKIFNIANYNSPKDNRLYIHIADPINEKIYLGFGETFQGNTFNAASLVDCFFRVKDPNGNIIYTSREVPKSGPGYIRNRGEAIAGPKGLNGGNAGYDPLIITPVVGLKGDYYIEFSRDGTENNTSNVRFDEFDITVGNQSSLNQTKGRLWAYQWSLVTLDGDNRSEAKFYTYTKDSVVTSFNMNGMKPFGFGVMCNQLGTNVSTNFAESRKSVAGATTRAYPEFKIFLNDPDPAVYPGYLTDLFIKAGYYNGCDRNQTCNGITLDVTKNTNVEILLNLNGIAGYQPNTRDVFITYDLVAGLNCVPWNGNDGLGAKVGNNEVVDMTAKLFNGLTNFPIYDPENNPDGLIVNIIRPLKTGQPANAIIPVYWDDSNIPGGSSNLVGCSDVGGCHTWLGNFGNDVTMNSWWYGSEFTDNIQLLIDPYPIASAYAGLDQVICERTNNNIPLTLGAAPPLLTAYKYSWTPLSSNANAAALTTPLQSTTSLNMNQLTGVAPNDTVAYTVEVDNFGCLASDTVLIIIKEVGKVKIFGKSEVCPNTQEVTYWIDKQLEVSSVNWTFSNSDITKNIKNAGSQDTIFVNFANTPGNINVEVVYNNPSCPRPRDSKPVAIVPLPTADPPFGKTKLCIKSERVQKYKVTPVAGSTYSWSIEAGKGTFAVDPFDATVATVTWDNSITNVGGTVTVNQTYIVSGAVCNVSPATLTVIGLDPIIGNPIGPIIACNGVETEILYPEFVNNQAGVTYRWQPTTGFKTANNIHNPRVNLNTLQGDTLKYGFTVTKDGCVHRDTVTYIVNPDARINNITGLNPICVKSDETYTVNDVFALPSRTWTVDNARANNIVPGTDNRSIFVKWGDTIQGTSLTVVSPSQFGCKPATLVYPIAMMKFPSFKPKYDSIICNAVPVTWGFKSGGDNGGDTYDWLLEAADINIVSPPSYAKAAGLQDTINATFNSEGLYYLRLRQTGGSLNFGENCIKEMDTLKINVFSEALIATNPDTIICQDGSAKLFVLGSPSGTPFKWYPKLTPSNFIKTDTITFVPKLQDRIIDYWVEYDVNGCKALDSVKVTVNPLPPKPLTTKEIEFCFEDNKELTLEGPTGYTYEWLPNGEATSSVQILPTFFTDNLQEAYISLKITDIAGCSNTDSTLLKAICDPRLFVPKAFSPNNDGYNDTLGVYGAHFKNFKIRIFNRWGEVIFESDDRNKIWDGTYRGLQVEAGVYPWVLSYESLRKKDRLNPREQKGSITVVR